MSNHGGLKEPAAPHTATDAPQDGEHERQRVLAIKLDLRGPEGHKLYQRLKDLSWQAARFRNLFLRALWAESKNLKVDPKKDIPHDVTKWIRADEKKELSGSAYAAAEQEVKAVWQRHAKRILAGAPLPEWRTNAALSIRGSNVDKKSSGVRLELGELKGELVDHPGGTEGDTGQVRGTEGGRGDRSRGTEGSVPVHTRDSRGTEGASRGQPRGTEGDIERGRFIAHLQVQSKDCEGGSWLKVPVALGTAKDYQAEMLHRMVAWEVPISKATVIVQPGKHAAILRLCYAMQIPLPRFGNRTATLGPIASGRLCLRTECDTRDFSGRLHTVLDRKENWDLIRRRATAQIGRAKGSARRKRKLLAKMTWQEWLTTTLHQWSHEIIDWLNGQGVARLTLVGLDAADWPIARFTQMLTYKGEQKGILVDTQADLADASTERAVKTEIQRRRRRTTKMGKALREIAHQGRK